MKGRWAGRVQIEADVAKKKEKERIKTNNNDKKNSSKRDEKQI